jgi:hypothetical protein
MSTTFSQTGVFGSPTRADVALYLAQDIPPLPGQPKMMDVETGSAFVGGDHSGPSFPKGQLDLAERQALLDQLMGVVGQDQRDLLQAIRNRLERCHLLSTCWAAQVLPGCTSQVQF